MKPFNILFPLCILVFSCQSTSKYAPEKYFNATQQQELLANMVTYIDAPAPGSDARTKFNVPYRKYYIQKAGKYQLLHLYLAPDSTYYYFLIRPAGNDIRYKRGVGGSFRLKNNSLAPVAFEETFNTPRLTEKEAAERGYYVFSELVKKQDISHLLSMKHYIEWPDSSLRYDKHSYSWIPQ